MGVGNDGPAVAELPLLRGRRLRRLSRRRHSSEIETDFTLYSERKDRQKETTTGIGTKCGKCSMV